MIYVLSTCTVVMGKRTEFENTVKEVTSVYEKYGAKTVGFWWTIGGETNEAVWINAWRSLSDFEKGLERVREDRNFPTEKVASIVITHTDKILKPMPFSPLK